MTPTQRLVHTYLEIPRDWREKNLDRYEQTRLRHLKRGHDRNEAVRLTQDDMLDLYEKEQSP